MDPRLNAIVRGLAVLLVAVAVAYIVRRLAKRALERRAVVDTGSAAVVAQLLQYAVMAVGVVFALQAGGLDLSSIVAASAFFVAAVGFALQGLAQDFLAGLALMAERSVAPGDILEVEGRVVRVGRIGFRSTIARGRDDVDLIIPNRLLVQQITANYTRRDALFRVQSKVGVHYRSDLDQVAAVLGEAARSVPGLAVNGPAPRVLLDKFADSAVEFDVSIWIEDPWNARVRTSDLNFAIWRALRAAGITIAFPQLDIHLDEGARPGPTP